MQNGYTFKYHAPTLFPLVVAIRPLRKYLETWTHVMHFKWEVTWTHGPQPNTFYMGQAGE